MFKGLPGFEVRSAGTQPSARIVVTEGLLGWADIILVMEKSHLRRLNEKYPLLLEEKTVIPLHIPDDFDYMQPELMDELSARVHAVLNDLAGASLDV